MRKQIIGAGLAVLVAASGMGVAVASAATAAPSGVSVSAKADHGKPETKTNKGKAVIQQARQLARRLNNLGTRLDRQAAALTEYPEVATELTALASTARNLVTEVNAATTKTQLRVLRQSMTAIIRQAGRVLATVDPSVIAELPEDVQPTEPVV